jgi:hypothetical protein
LPDSVEMDFTDFREMEFTDLMEMENAVWGVCA